MVQSSGLPIFSGCTGSDYCKAHGDQHALHTGFFSAIRTFAQEAFRETNLEGIRFDQIQINFKGDTNTGIYLALVHPKQVPREAIEIQLERALEIFMTKFSPYVSEFTQLKDEDTAKFKEDLMKLGIIRTPKLTNLIPMQITRDSPKWKTIFSGFFKSKK